MDVDRWVGMEKGEHVDTRMGVGEARPRMGVDGKRERTRPWIGKGDHKALASGHWTLAHAVRVGGWVREGPLQGPYMLGGSGKSGEGRTGARKDR